MKFQKRFSIPLGVFIGFFSSLFFLIGCVTSVSTDAPNNNTAATDSLDAQFGKEKLNAYNFKEGNKILTQNPLDLAIEGDGFFVLKNNQDYVYFRRPAQFLMDANGFMVLGNSNTRLQGKKLYSNEIPYPNLFSFNQNSDTNFSQDVTDIHCSFDDVAPPRATTEIRLSRNLDSDSRAFGSILYTQKYLANASESATLVGLSGHNGIQLGIQSGDVLSFSATNPVSGAQVQSAPFTVTGASTLFELKEAIQTFLRSSPVGAGLTTAVDVVTDDPTKNGALTIYNNNGNPIQNLQISSSRPISGPAVTKAFSVPSTIPKGSVKNAIVTDTLRTPANSSDLVSDIYDANGNSLGLEAGDQISFSGSIGADLANNVTPMNYLAGIGGTTMQDIMNKIKDNFKLPATDGTIEANLSVEINIPGRDDNIPDGSIVIRGQPGTDFAIKGVAIHSTNSNNGAPSPNSFESNMNITALRDAGNSQIPSCSFPIYDELGKVYPGEIDFLPTATPNQWIWTASIKGSLLVVKNNKGKLVFGSDGTVNLFGFDENADHVEVLTQNGTPSIKIKINAGGPKDFTGLTQFRSATTVAVVSRNGFPSGVLENFEVSFDGIISGNYTNNQTRPLYRIALAKIPNKFGLQLIGKNSFLETMESGKPKLGAAKSLGYGMVLSSEIEMDPL